LAFLRSSGGWNGLGLFVNKGAALAFDAGSQLLPYLKLTLGKAKILFLLFAIANIH